MSRRRSSFANLVGRVELFARGADELRRTTEQALEARRPARALRAARRLKEQTPDAPLALALWADAAAACGLDEEQCAALEALARLVPWRAELWLRLGLLGAELGRPIAREALERAACTPGDERRVRAALLALCDLDLAAGEPARALRWLERTPTATDDDAPGFRDEIDLRVGECACALGLWERARQAAERLGPVGRRDGRDRLLLAKVFERADQAALRARALEHAIAAFVIAARGAERVLLRLLMGLPTLPEEASRSLRERACVLMASASPEAIDPWRAAMLLGEGRAEEAKALLRDAAAQGRTDATAMLLSVATQTEDLDSLAAAAEAAPSLLSDGHRALLEAVRHRESGRDEQALDALGRAASALPTWAGSLADDLLAGWLPDPHAGGATQWTPVVRELRRAARLLEDPEALAELDTLAQERGRPLQLALVGEFNAGKSTLLNAWLGAEVAPTGVLPTTGCVHRVAWAPEPFVRIVVEGQSDRIVGHEQLPRALEAVERSGGEVAEVMIYAPLEPLRRVELLDTPGLNAPDHRGRELTLAAVRRAHLALWLLDATTPLKESERRAMLELADAGVPIQVVVNKLDRLTDAERPVVLEHVIAGLREAGIESYRAPLGLSAALALQSRLGNESARAAAGYQALVALLGEHVFDRAAVLRESALRRKGRRLSHRLHEGARARARALERARAERAALERALDRLARRLEQEPGSVIRRLVAALRPAAQALESDLRPLARHGGRQPSEEPEAQRYAVERAIDRLGPPLVAAIAGWAVELTPALAATGDALPELLRPAVEAALVGVVCGLSTPPLDATALARVAEAALRSAAREIDRRRSGNGATPDVIDVAWRLERLVERLGA